MFWQEEDVQPSVNIAVEMFGPVGNMLTGTDVSRNVSLATREYGKLWYGDVYSADANATLTEFAKKIGKTVYVFDSNNHFTYDDAYVVKHV